MHNSRTVIHTLVLRHRLTHAYHSRLSLHVSCIVPLYLHHAPVTLMSFVSFPSCCTLLLVTSYLVSSHTCFCQYPGDLDNMIYVSHAHRTASHDGTYRICHKLGRLGSQVHGTVPHIGYKQRSRASLGHVADIARDSFRAVLGCYRPTSLPHSSCRPRGPSGYGRKIS